MKNIDVKLEEKLLKLYRLAKEGVGGEAVNAQEILEGLLIKHNITIDMLIDSETKLYFFSYKTSFEKDILFRIFSKIKDFEKNITYTQIGNKKKIGFNLTAFEYIEFEIQREAYIESWKKYLKQAQTAFVFSSRLSYCDPSSKKTKEDRKLTPEEYAEMQAILQMSISVPDPKFKRNLLR